MKSACTLILATTLVSPVAFAQSLVNGTNYSGLYGGTPSSITVSPPVNPGAVADVRLGGTTGSQALGTYWHATATGGLSVGALTIPVATSGAQVALSGSSLQFNVANSGLLNTILGGITDAGVSGITTSWSATATFNKAGSVLLLAPNTTYQVSFLVDGHNGLLNSTLGITPSFTVEMLDGAGVSVGTASSGTLVNIAGLLGTGVQSGIATVNFTTGSTVNGTSAASLRFGGSSVLNATALGLGTNFATVSNLSITQVPEPSSFGLLGLGALALLRRKR